MLSLDRHLPSTWEPLFIIFWIGFPSSNYVVIVCPWAAAMAWALSRLKLYCWWFSSLNYLIVFYRVLEVVMIWGCKWEVCLFCCYATIPGYSLMYWEAWLPGLMPFSCIIFTRVAFVAFKELVVFELHMSIAFEKLLFFASAPVLKMMAGGLTVWLAFPAPFWLCGVSSSSEEVFGRLPGLPAEPWESIPRLPLSREVVSTAPLS